jgi:hypothetical protein
VPRRLQRASAAGTSKGPIIIPLTPESLIDIDEHFSGAYGVPETVSAMNFDRSCETCEGFRRFHALAKVWRVGQYNFTMYRLES